MEKDINPLFEIKVNMKRLKKDIETCLSLSTHSCDRCHYQHISSPRCKVEMLKDCLRVLEGKGE